MMRAIAALLIGALAPVAGAQATPSSVEERRVDSLFAQYTRGSTPGVAVAVVRDGRKVLSKGYGLASLEHRVPITPTTVFDVASVSKQFTGLAIAMLVEEGRIKLTDDIRKYIPELGDVGHTITIEHLVHHTSGLRDWPGSLSLAGWRMDDVVSFDQILNMAYHQRSLNFVPGAEYTYSNTGYNLLAELVHRVTGQSFRAWTDEHLFRPLGMTNTRFRDDHTWVVPNRAFGYARGADGSYSAVTNNLTALGSSSLFTTVDDLAKWVMNFDDPKVGGAAALAMTRTRGRLNDGTTIPYGFGIVNGEYRGQPIVNHSGSWAAFATFVLHFPAQHFGVIVLANTGINAGRAAYDIADIYLARELGPPPPPAPNAIASAPAVDVAPAVLDRYAGLYRLGPGWYVRVRRDGGSLRVQATREAEVAMSARSDTTFWVADYNAAMTFQVPAAGPTTLTYRTIHVPKLAESAPLTAAQLRDVVGDYESQELQVRYRIELTDSGLVMRHPRHGTIVLTPLWRDELGGSTWFTRSVELRRDEAGRVVGLSVYIDERSRDIRFTRLR
jgi:CubicO group peptidase (beta-lactamase class C family)